MNKLVLKSLLVSMSLSILSWGTLKSAEDLNNNEAEPHRNERVEDRVASLANLCVQHIVNHFEDHVPEAGPSMLSGLPYDLQKHLLFVRLAYLKQVIDEAYAAGLERALESLNEDNCTATSSDTEMKTLKDTYYSTLIRCLPHVLSYAEITPKEAQVLAESILKAINGKHVLDIINMLAHCNTSNAAQLKAALVDYGIHYGESGLFTSVVPKIQSTVYKKLKKEDIDHQVFNINAPQLYATGNEISEQEIINNLLTTRISTCYTVQDSQGKELQLITPTISSGQSSKMPIAQSTHKEQRVLWALPECQKRDVDSMMYLTLFLGSSFMDLLADYMPLGIIGNVTRAFLNRQCTSLLLQVDDQTWLTRELPGYVSALVHDQLTLQEMIYVLALGYLAHETFGDDCTSEVVCPETQEKLRNHPALQSIRVKNEVLYNDLIAKLADIACYGQQTSAEKLMSALEDAYASYDSDDSEGVYDPEEGN